jgi:pheromone shutdown protein TraB
VIVGVVGLGHVKGILANWESPIDSHELNRVPQGGTSIRAVVLTFFCGASLVLSAAAYGLYSAVQWWCGA